VGCRVYGIGCGCRLFKNAWSPQGLGFGFNVCFCERACVRACVCVCDDMCCLLVIDSVTSTSQWIRQPKPRVYL
jgi:hypothetical protein